MSKLVVTIDDEKFLVKDDNFPNIEMNNTEYNVSISKLSEYTYKLQLGTKVYHITSTKLDNNKFSFLIDGHYFESFVRTKLEEESATILNTNFRNNGKGKINSPMPGLIIKVNKKVGESVDEGEPVILLEAMKMENEIKSPTSGIISEIFVKTGQSVDKNENLIIIE